MSGVEPEPEDWRPSYLAPKANVLPLHYTRKWLRIYKKNSSILKGSELFYIKARKACPAELVEECHAELFEECHTELFQECHTELVEECHAELVEALHGAEH